MATTYHDAEVGSGSLKDKEMRHLDSPDHDGDSMYQRNPLFRRLGNSWTQILLVSFCCFCLPGMYNAISGMGGSGQLDPTVSAADCG